MSAALTAALGVILGLAALEASARLHRWRRVPSRLRTLYALGLLNGEAIHAIDEIRQRVERAGVRSFEELFAHYAAASGKSVEEIEARFGFPLSWRRLRRSRLILRNHLHWHAGLVPVPGQRLRTTTIEGDGTRATGTASGPRRGSASKSVLLTGGSVAYGYGATADETTIAGRLEYYLNRDDPRPHGWRVINRAFPAATSFQELIVALQHTDSARPPDYVVSLTGCNDVDSQFNHAEPNISALAQAYTDALERRSVLRALFRDLGRRSVVLNVLRRLAAGYRHWPGAAGAGVRREIDGPNVYPLW